MRVTTKWIISAAQKKKISCPCQLQLWPKCVEEKAAASYGFSSAAPTGSFSHPTVYTTTPNPRRTLPTLLSPKQKNAVLSELSPYLLYNCHSHHFFLPVFFCGTPWCTLHSTRLSLYAQVPWVAVMKKKIAQAGWVLCCKLLAYCHLKMIRYYYCVCALFVHQPAVSFFSLW